MKLSESQQKLMNQLSTYKGQTVQVQTSQHTHSGSGKPLYPETWQPITITTTATLRGLEAKGLIKCDHFWRGANVTIL